MVSDNSLPEFIGGDTSPGHTHGYQLSGVCVCGSRLAGRTVSNDDDDNPRDASTDDYEDSQSNTTRQSAGDGFRNNELAGRSNDEPTDDMIAAAAKAIGGYSDEQWQRWQHTSKGQQAHDRAVVALAAALPLDPVRARLEAVTTELAQVRDEQIEAGEIISAARAEIDELMEPVATVERRKRLMHLSRRGWTLATRVSLELNAEKERAEAAEAETLRLRTAVEKLRDEMVTSADDMDVAYFEASFAAVLGGKR